MPEQHSSESKHEPVPACPGYGTLACVACSEREDRCVPWPCGNAPSGGAS